MSVPARQRLAWAKPVLRAMWLLVFGSGALILGAIVFSFVIEDRVLAYLHSLAPGRDAAWTLVGLRLAAGIGVVMVPLFHIVLTRLIAIVNTVRIGDPFVPENAARLLEVARASLGLQLLHLAFGVIASLVSSENVRVEWTFSISGWIAVVLLFVLASVFEHGTRMRHDLEGVV